MRKVVCCFAKKRSTGEDDERDELDLNPSVSYLWKSHKSPEKVPEHRWQLVLKTQTPREDGTFENINGTSNGGANSGNGGRGNAVSPSIEVSTSVEFRGGNGANGRGTETAPLLGVATSDANPFASANSSSSSSTPIPTPSAPPAPAPASSCDRKSITTTAHPLPSAPEITQWSRSSRNRSFASLEHYLRSFAAPRYKTGSVLNACRLFHGSQMGPEFSAFVNREACRPLKTAEFYLMLERLDQEIEDINAIRGLKTSVWQMFCVLMINVPTILMNLGTKLLQYLSYM